MQVTSILVNTVARRKVFMNHSDPWRRPGGSTQAIADVSLPKAEIDHGMLVQLLVSAGMPSVSAEMRGTE